MDNEIKKGRNIAYIRVSTLEQNTARQMDAFKDFGIDKYFSEKISGASKNRPELMKLLEYVQEGDTVYVSELSRLARNMVDMCELADFFNKKGVVLKSLKENIDLSSPQGVLTMHIFEAMAQFERELIRERQAEGIAAAKARGVKWGKEQQYGLDKGEADKIMYDYYYGNIDKATAMKMFGATKSTFYRHYDKWMHDNNVSKKR